MPLTISGPHQNIVLEPSRLCQNAFAPFGTVIENPAPSLQPSSSIQQLPPNAVHANQGSALKYLDVTRMVNLYSSAPSGKPGKALVNMFVCAHRSLLPPPVESQAKLLGNFPVNILERHPYTTQTFIPLGLSPSEARQARYLVIVAPSLEPSPRDESFPVPSHRGSDIEGSLSGRGLPDLTKIMAFIANGAQAVTYGAGTWHAPMVVVGSSPIDFVVVQFANGEAIEDCQEVELQTSNVTSLLVAVPIAGSSQNGGVVERPML
ncbi:ureidoglycolate hydrolase [Tricladium varicosporioides]|nr:ureidoglycolate hydrolase [Hymenoscyphus varicosporioides]